MEGESGWLHKSSAFAGEHSLSVKVKLIVGEVCACEWVVRCVYRCVSLGHCSANWCYYAVCINDMMLIYISKPEK